MLLITVVLITNLISISGIENNRYSFKELKTVSTNINNPSNEKDQTTNILNNKSLSFDKAIKDESVVMISYTNSVSNKTHNDNEIYNINKLDKFMENVNKGNRDKVRIVKYGRNETGTWVNKLFDLEYDGKKIKDIGYDVYSNSNVFIPVEITYSDFMKKREYPDALWYGLCFKNNNGKECYSLISFKKSNIVDINP